MSHLAPDAGKNFGWEAMADVPPFAEHDPSTAGWERRRDDPNVQARVAHLNDNAGIKGLEVCAPHEIERIVEIFLRDGVSSQSPSFFSVSSFFSAVSSKTFMGANTPSTPKFSGLERKRLEHSAPRPGQNRPALED